MYRYNLDIFNEGDVVICDERETHYSEWIKVLIPQPEGDYAEAIELRILPKNQKVNRHSDVPF